MIRSDSIDPSLPMVIGNPSVEDFFLIRQDILKSLISFKDINIEKALIAELTFYGRIFNFEPDNILEDLKIYNY